MYLLLDQKLSLDSPLDRSAMDSVSFKSLETLSKVKLSPRKYVFEYRVIEQFRNAAGSGPCVVIGWLFVVIAISISLRLDSVLLGEL